MIGYFTDEELQGMGFAELGKEVRISRTATFYNCHKISIGSHVRVDNFCTVAPSGQAKLVIGNYVHISAYNFLNGAADLVIEDFVTTAPFVRVFTSSDDYSGASMTGAVVPRNLIATTSGKIHIKQHVIIGVGSTILPGITLGTGTAVGGHSFVKESTQDFSIVAGVPARVIGERKKDLLELAKLINE